MSAVRNPSWRWLVLLIAASLVLASEWAVGFPQRQANAQQTSEEPAEAGTEEPAEAETEEPAEAETEEPAEAETEEPADEGGVGELTSDLGLDSATIEFVELDDGIEEYVRYRFADLVREVNDIAGFAVRSETGASEVSSTSATIVPGSEDEVLVGFPDGTDLARFRTASVITGAVSGTSDRGNVTATVTLAVSEASETQTMTSGPDLIDLEANETLNRVTYVFDNTLDEGTGPAASDFGYRTVAGRDIEATSVLSVDGETVLVEFGVAIDDEGRYFVRAGAVRDRLGQVNPPNALGGGTTAPELDSVARVQGATQYDFTFTQPVALAAVDRFALYTRSGVRYPAGDWARVAPETLRLHVPDAEDVSAEVVIGAVDAGAVEDTAGAGITNGVGAAAVPPPPGGPAAGPELVAVSVEGATGQVRFQFTTEPEDAVIDPADFLALTSDGELVAGRRHIEVDGDEVLIGFDRHIAEAADLYVVNAGAVMDADGRVNSSAMLPA